MTDPEISRKSKVVCRYAWFFFRPTRESSSHTVTIYIIGQMPQIYYTRHSTSLNSEGSAQSPMQTCYSFLKYSSAWGFGQDS